MNQPGSAAREACTPTALGPSTSALTWSSRSQAWSGHGLLRGPGSRPPGLVWNWIQNCPWPHRLGLETHRAGLPQPLFTEVNPTPPCTHETDCSRGQGGGDLGVRLGNPDSPRRQVPALGAVSLHKEAGPRDRVWPLAGSQQEPLGSKKNQCTEPCPGQEQWRPGGGGASLHPSRHLLPARRLWLSSLLSSDVSSLCPPSLLLSKEC